jgi:hypothetical protein
MAELDEKSLDAILDREEKDIARISENEFKMRLLPVLVNQGDESNLQAWLAVAGTWRRQVEVLDDKTGEPLFIVPALVGGTGQPTLQTAANSAYELIENAQKKMRVVPRAGDEMLIKGLTSRVSVAGDRQKAIDAWNYIYRRYGYDDLVVKSNSDSTKEDEAPVKSGSDFSGYDEA